MSIRLKIRQLSNAHWLVNKFNGPLETDYDGCTECLSLADALEEAAGLLRALPGAAVELEPAA